MKLSVVIPALNEEPNMPRVLGQIPAEALRQQGWDLEVIVVDNASTDGTARIAAELGAIVVHQPNRGYGNAYHAGFAAATGDVIATGDADCTYPFDALPTLILELELQGFDFMSTNRLGRANHSAMKTSHIVGNHLLTAASKTLFPRSPFRDSQSGMWIFRRAIWEHLDVRSNGMQFSQEIKNEAFLKGFCCGEVSIEYRTRGGQVKLNATKDGLQNGWQLLAHRVRARRVSANASVIVLPEPAVSLENVTTASKALALD
ncbi:glycosyltransferase family 2 protein [Kineococcus radiotolerans]|uniref:Glycosyl transferase family 2 n=1 Tax=Kineococcus radiotolerans (strain ATCC BAA-149 / DSM 14245 / SRS30216) TaxID=266940 RepID=A6W6V6_KINRD|nr:glycosyltransferase family 2 protein [Kineococcus radiotolerans]ABS02545.1 glycosyl transferase family 2 [Kineococcus radiotolerans SRS30216 = ATCC BAA-149]